MSAHMRDTRQKYATDLPDGTEEVKGKIVKPFLTESISFYHPPRVGLAVVI